MQPEPFAPSPTTCECEAAEFVFQPPAAAVDPARARETLDDCDASVARLRAAAERAQIAASDTDPGFDIGQAALAEGRRAEAVARREDRATLDGVLAAIFAGNRAYGWYRIARIEFDSAARVAPAVQTHRRLAA